MGRRNLSWGSYHRHLTTRSSQGASFEGVTVISRPSLVYPGSILAYMLQVLHTANAPDTRFMPISSPVPPSVLLPPPPGILLLHPPPCSPTSTPQPMLPEPQPRGLNSRSCSETHSMPTLAPPTALQPKLARTRFSRAHKVCPKPATNRTGSEGSGRRAFRLCLPSGHK